MTERSKMLLLFRFLYSSSQRLANLFSCTEEKEGKIWLAKRTNIATGLSYDGKIVVEEGLAAGQNLIIAGYKGLSDGQEIVIAGR